MIEDIEDFREDQYADYQRTLSTDSIECNKCHKRVDRDEIEYFSMYEEPTKEYCKDCIDNYLNE